MLKSSGDINLHRTFDDDDDNNPENDDDGDDVSDSVSDLDSFTSNRSQRQFRYRYAHLPKPMTLRITSSKLMQSPINDASLRRSHSLNTLQAYGLRQRFNRNDCIVDTTSSMQLDQQYEKHQQKHQPLNGDTIAHLERDTLHGDVWRSVLSSRRGTQNFVINPLFSEQNTTKS